MAKAIKKIKRGIQRAPRGALEPDNWIIWGLILRYNANYKSSRHKYIKALKIEPGNETAR